MAVREVIVSERERTLTIVMDLETPSPSASGKTMVVASTRGNARTDAKIDGKPLTVGVNAYYPR